MHQEQGLSVMRIFIFSHKQKGQGKQKAEGVQCVWGDVCAAHLCLSMRVEECMTIDLSM